MTRESLVDAGYEDVVVFENPDYDDCIIGVSSDRRAIYSMEKMVRWLMTEDHISEEDARDFICYNTLRSLPYIGETAPIVMEYEEVDIENTK